MKFLLEKTGANPKGNVAMLDFFLLATVLHLLLATMLLLSAPWFITPLVFYWSLIYRREDKYPGSSPAPPGALRPPAPRRLPRPRQGRLRHRLRRRPPPRPHLHRREARAPRVRRVDPRGRRRARRHHPLRRLHPPHCRQVIPVLTDDFICFALVWFGFLSFPTIIWSDLVSFQFAHHFYYSLLLSLSLSSVLSFRNCGCAY